MRELAEFQGWQIELGVRETTPQDADYDPTLLWVERVPTGNARFRCGDHLDTGWKPRAEVQREASAHLLDAHEVISPWRVPADGG